MELDLRRRAARLGRALKNYSWPQRAAAAAAIAAVLAVIVFAIWTVASGIGDALATRSQTKRDGQHNANVNAAVGSADANHNRADAHALDRQVSEGQYQESRRDVERARARAAAARDHDREATRRHEETRRARTSDLRAVSDDDVCAELRSVGISADGCGEK